MFLGYIEGAEFKNAMFWIIKLHINPLRAKWVGVKKWEDFKNGGIFNKPGTTITWQFLCILGLLS